MPRIFFTNCVNHPASSKGDGMKTVGSGFQCHHAKSLGIALALEDREYMDICCSIQRAE